MKNKDYSLISKIAFEKKRILRLFSLYFMIAGITYFISDLVIYHLGFGKFFRDLFFVSWFTEASTKYWYILAIALFYLIFPLLYYFIYNGAMALTKTVLFCICWWICIEVICYFIPAVSHFRIALERLPIFIFGIYCGKLSYDKVKLDRVLITLIAIWGYFLFAFLKAPIIKNLAEPLYYPMRAFLSLSIIVTAIFIFEWLESKMKTVYGMLIVICSWFGSVTLELYLLHQSYMILFDFPYKALYYCIVAFCLPTVTAALITIIKKKVRT